MGIDLSPTYLSKVDPDGELVQVVVVIRNLYTFQNAQGTRKLVFRNNDMSVALHLVEQDYDKFERVMFGLDVPLWEIMNFCNEIKEVSIWKARDKNGVEL